MTNKYAIDVLQEVWKYEKTYKYTDYEIRTAINLAIKSLEERPQGKWKALDYHTCYCTNCHFDFDIMKCDFMAKMTFGPNCGADMRGDK